MPELETNDGTTLWYDERGPDDAPPVVLLHGFTSSHRMWHAQRAELEDRYRLIVPDLRGHGRSGAPEDLGTYSIERYATDVHELLDHLKIGVCALVGCSFGGMIALQFAVTWPERLACLVASDASPAYEHVSYDERFREREEAMRANEAFAEERGMAGLGKRLAANVHDPFLADGIRKRYAAMAPAGYLGAARTRRERPDVTPLLRERLTMPVLLCDGDADPVFCALDVMARELPEARVAIFEGADHGLPSQRPEAFTAVLREFLEDVEAGTAVAGRIVIAT
ncbi:MAG: alpha/beta fold hydrolase [Dehalococcoidia bacterium]|nr:alpha/beta fold hydrolase [Dehalococcoidia bacterium]MCB9485454.1 alpha/beta fold hydrolase [Thermoflexaceae bacterium]